MADFILNRNRKIINVDPYPFPEGVFPIYGNGRFYNGFSIGDTSNLSVVNREGVLKFSRGAANEYEETSVILGTMPKNKKTTIYIDIASPLSQSLASVSGYTASIKIGSSQLPTYKAWTTAQITNTEVRYQENVKAGGVLSIYFKSRNTLPEIPDLLAVRALWAGGG